MHNTPTTSYDVALLADDMALRGWSITDLARKADVSRMTVWRFLNAEHQTARTALKISKALGYRTTRRYLISSKEVAA